MKKQRWRFTKFRKCCVCKKKIEKGSFYGNLNDKQFWCFDCM